MLVQHLLEFIKKIQSQELSQLDNDLLHKIASRFASCKAIDTALSNADVNFLVGCFKERWDEIQDGPEDYTLSGSKTNREWYAFARQLAKVANIPYLQVLMPNITNSTDPINNSQLTETETLTNFLIGDNNLLYRKRALCDLMASHGYKLVTYKNQRLAPVSIEELSRLKRCIQYEGKFSIEKKVEKRLVETNFSSFWDFMRRWVFPQLSAHGTLPTGLLPHLLELVEHYYVLKAKGPDNIQTFKRECANFFRRLYRYDLSHINCLYGQEIVYQGSKAYLLDVFISLFEANGFHLEAEMEALASFLYNTHPVLKARSKELAPLYPASNDRQNDEQTEAYQRCLSLLVSLYVFKFKIFLISGHTVSGWDMQNSLPGEIHAIYTALHTVFTAKQRDYVMAYNDIIKDHVLHEKRGWQWLFRDASVQHWLKNVAETKLSEVGGYWFEPELIISALYIFDTNRSEIKERTNQFLNHLVSTYAQTASEFQKQLRVNILFSQFLSSLGEYQRRNIISLIAMYNPRTAKKHFIDQCIAHINNNLVALGYIPQESSPSFFGSTKPSVTLKVPEELSTVITVVDYYVQNLPLQHLKTSVQEKIRAYLFELKKPILTCEEKEAARKSAQSNVDCIGAPT